MDGCAASQPLSVRSPSSMDDWFILVTHNLSTRRRGELIHSISTLGGKEPGGGVIKQTLLKLYNVSLQYGLNIKKKVLIAK